MRAFVSWSGGKESCLSCYKVRQDRSIEIVCSLNMISEDGSCSRTHGISSQLLKAQAQAINMAMVQKKTAWPAYEEQFKKAVFELKKEGIEAGVFGDIDLEEHREWVERVCRETDIRPIFPLWQKRREDILGEFIGVGFEAVVVAVRSLVMDSRWLGQSVDKCFMEKIEGLKNVDLCGEAGEYHTFVTGGPIFEKKIEILKTRKVKKDEHYLLDILDYEVEGKR